MGVLYGVEFLNMGRIGRAVFILLLIPIAMISNVLRITFLCIVANTWGSGAASGWVHDLSGYAVYAIAMILMIALGRILRAIPRMKGRATCESDS